MSPFNVSLLPLDAVDGTDFLISSIVGLCTIFLISGSSTSALAGTGVGNVAGAFLQNTEDANRLMLFTIEHGSCAGAIGSAALTIVIGFPKFLHIDIISTWISAIVGRFFGSMSSAAISKSLNFCVTGPLNGTVLPKSFFPESTYFVKSSFPRCEKNGCFAASTSQMMIAAVKTSDASSGIWFLRCSGEL